MRPVRMKRLVIGLFSVLGLSLVPEVLSAQSLAPYPPAQALDYEFFKAKVEPIFLKPRPGHARCVLCHAGEGKPGEPNNGGPVDRPFPFRLERLTPGATFWTEEQSQVNFWVAAHLVTPGKPQASLLLMHPLSPAAGREPFYNGGHHNGGHQFESKDDPDWQILSQWVQGAKITGTPEH
jgi:hypothetical protein